MEWWCGGVGLGGGGRGEKEGLARINGERITKKYKCAYPKSSQAAR